MSRSGRILDNPIVIVVLDMKLMYLGWGLYQEDMPYSGFEGFGWVNQKNGANDYVRKHK